MASLGVLPLERFYPRHDRLELVMELDLHPGRAMARENATAFENMKVNLLANRLVPEKVPLVLQYNKQDLEQLLSREELEGVLNPWERKAFPAVAARDAMRRLGIADAKLEAAAERLRRHGATVSTALLESSDVSHAILDAGDEFDADLIVLGHKGKGAIERFLMGSVTPRIAHHACISVLAVR